MYYLSINKQLLKLSYELKEYQIHLARDQTVDCTIHAI